MTNKIDKLASFLRRYWDFRLIFIMDLFLSLFSSLLVLMSADYMSSSHPFGDSFGWIWICSSAVGSMLAMFVTGTYKIIIRHLSVRDVSRYMLAATLKCAFILAVMLLGGKVAALCPVPSYFAWVLVFDFLLTCFLIVGVRVALIVLYSVYGRRLNGGRRSGRVLIVGIGNKSVSAMKRLETSLKYDVIGFITSKLKTNHYSEISTYRVYSFVDEENFSNLVETLNPDVLLFSNADDVRKSQKMISLAVQRGIKVMITPEEGEINALNMVRAIKVEDLLQREEIKISTDRIEQTFKGSTVLVTGAAGSIGSELCRIIVTFGVKKLVLFDNAETPMHSLRLELEDKFPYLDFVPVIGDVRYERRLNFAFRKFRPDFVFHAAAYKHVPLMEENPCEAVLVNLSGSRLVSEKCLQYGVKKMIMVSTDKAVNPTNIMGCTKRLAEIYVQSLGLAVESGKVAGSTKFVTTRFGNVLGSNGSVIPRFSEQIATGGPVTVTHPEITRFFMTIPEACRLVMEAATISKGNEIVVFDMGEPVKVVDLARKMIELSGLKEGEEIEIKFTGLRPGEKLYEEVLSSVENTKPTSHGRIRIANVREYPFEDVREITERLVALAINVEIPEMVKLMKETVPEYVSNNSQFELYDKHQSA